LEDNSKCLKIKILIKIKKTLDRINDAYLNYQQALKFNNHSKTVTRALFNMAKINILDKDFYTASYNLNKTDHLELKKEKLINIMLFTNGVNFLSKSHIICLNQLGFMPDEEKI